LFLSATLRCLSSSLISSSFSFFLMSLLYNSAYTSSSTKQKYKIQSITISKLITFSLPLPSYFSCRIFYFSMIYIFYSPYTFNSLKSASTFLSSSAFLINYYSLLTATNFNLSLSFSSFKCATLAIIFYLISSGVSYISLISYLYYSCSFPSK